MVFGLLRGHTSIEAASRELLAISMRLQREYPRANTGVIASPIPLREQFVGRTRPAILVLAVGVLAILLTTCANIAGLMISRSTTRARDVAIKTALGAPRLALFREYFGESILLSPAGGAVGVLVAAYCVPLLSKLVPLSLAARYARVGPVFRQTSV